MVLGLRAVGSSFFYVLKFKVGHFPPFWLYVQNKKTKIAISFSRGRSSDGRELAWHVRCTGIDTRRLQIIFHTAERILSLIFVRINVMEFKLLLLFIIISSFAEFCYIEN